MKKMNYLLLILCVFLFLCGCKKTENANRLTNQTDTIDSEKLEESKKETTKTETYEVYSGLWSVDGKSDEQIQSEGGTKCSITIINQTQLSGTLFSQQGTSERFAELPDFTSTIKNGECYYTFMDDGFGGSGTLHFSFLEDMIRIDVQGYQADTNNRSGFGISGVYELIRTENDSEKNDTELSKENIQQRIYDKYYALWSDDELLAAIEERRVYLDHCSFYPEVEGYMEQIREVRDGSNVIEPLYYTDMKNYQKEDFENVPALMLRLAKNEIYARRGYIFQDSDLNNYFMGQLWYEPSISPDDFDTSVFNEYEIFNLQLLVDLE